MLDYKDIIIKHYALSLSGSEIARQLGVSKSGVNDFLRAFDKSWLLKFLGKSSVKHSQIHQVSYSISALRN